MNNGVDNIINNLSETYNGTPWHGSSFKDLLQDLTVDMAFYRPFENKHNIAELVAHTLVWRQFTLEMLSKNYNFNIDIGALADFPKVDKSEKIWQELQIQLEENQALLIEKLSQFSDAQLEEQVPKKHFIFRYLFEGLIYHDVYHAGQIGYLKAAYMSQTQLDKNIIRDVANKLTFK
jgi:hypothetical protein